MAFGRVRQACISRQKLLPPRPAALYFEQKTLYTSTAPCKSLKIYAILIIVNYALLGVEKDFGFVTGGD